ncbi:MAG: hypothetical protein M5U26_21625 [Planctomycetota bacterium]|nr:hypothetical protein [Planctomycetota bacterium]
MASRNKTLGYLLMFLFLSPLALLFVYLWKFEYNPQPAPEFPGGFEGGGTPVAIGTPHPGDSTNLAVSLELDAETWTLGEARGEKGARRARMVLSNTGRAKIRLLDSASPSKLAELNVVYLGEKGDAKQERLPSPHAPQMPPTSTPVWGVVELLPGRRLVVELSVVPGFAIKNPGEYRMQAVYDPMAFAQAHGLDLDALGVLKGQRLSQRLDLRVVEQLEAEAQPKPEPPPEAAPAAE